MKNIILTIAFFAFSQLIIAQNIPYYSSTSMETYEELIDPIPLSNGELWDEQTIYNLYLDFEFVFFYQPYTSISVYAGGGIVFSGYGAKRIRAFHLPYAGYLLRAKGLDGSISSIDYQISGIEGEYILKVQWESAGFIQDFETSDNNDFVNFQIWLYQEDGHVEFRFGPNETRPGTYGFPNHSSHFGSCMEFLYDSCNNILSYYSNADNPAYDYFDMCGPESSYLDGTPSEGITYTITRNENFVNIPEQDAEKLMIYPNPVTQNLMIDHLNDFDDIEFISILNIYGETMIDIKDINHTETQRIVNTEALSSGIYFVKIKYQDKVLINRFIKN